MTSYSDPRLAAIEGALVEVDGALARALAESVDDLGRGEVSAQEVAALVEQTRRAEARLDALRLRLMRVAEAAAVESESAASGADAWLAGLTGSSRSIMRGGLWLARRLRRYRHVLDACVAGDLDETRARVLVRACDRIPAGVAQADREKAELQLVERAVRERLSADRLRRIARRMCEAFSPQLADEQEAEMLTDEEKHAEFTSWFCLDDNGDGTMTGKFGIPELQGRMLLTMLEHLSAPRRLGRTAEGRSTVDPTVPPWGYHERLGAAFVELIEHLPTDGLAMHGRVGATVVVHIDLDHLIDGLGAAHVDCGADVSAGTARRMACNAGLIPGVFGGDSMPLDLGRERRLHSKAQRIALSSRYDCCAAEGCRRPFAWCEIHHLIEWAGGGCTDLDNAIPLCGWHHRRVHDEHYQHSVGPDGVMRFRERRWRPRAAA